jgi:acetolactate synthase-1/2/3 large subunit
MKVSDYITQTLVNCGTEYAFGVPGIALLGLIDSLMQIKGITPILTYNEQAAAFSAIGYASVSRKLGVAYATRGPGFTNLITGIASAYFDSVPILFITAHSSRKSSDVRYEEKQQIDTINIVLHITKFASVVETVEELPKILMRAIYESISGRPGPTLIDINSALFKNECPSDYFCYPETSKTTDQNLVEIVLTALKQAYRPVILIGDGIHQAGMEQCLRDLIEKVQIPVVSSRFALDLLPASKLYFGHIGSHARPEANWILAHSDLIITLGNRLEFNQNSISFAPIMEKKLIRIDIDSAELGCSRSFNEIVIQADLKNFLLQLILGIKRQDATNWIYECQTVKQDFTSIGQCEIVNRIRELFFVSGDIYATSDVGNNEIFLAYAAQYQPNLKRLLWSKNFGSLGFSIPAAVGMALALKKPVFAFTGDQGLMFNLAELQTISNLNLPIKVVVLNNMESGLIADRQRENYGGRLVHSDEFSGYNPPNVSRLAKTFGLGNDQVIEIRFSSKSNLFPYLPMGNKMWNFIVP